MSWLILCKQPVSQSVITILHGQNEDQIIFLKLSPWTFLQRFFLWKISFAQPLFSAQTANTKLPPSCLSVAEQPHRCRKAETGPMGRRRPGCASPSLPLLFNPLPATSGKRYKPPHLDPISRPHYVCLLRYQKQLPPWFSKTVHMLDTAVHAHNLSNSSLLSRPVRSLESQFQAMGPQNYASVSRIVDVRVRRLVHLHHPGRIGSLVPRSAEPW
jgi:hypothetical protein